MLLLLLSLEKRQIPFRRTAVVVMAFAFNILTWDCTIFYQYFVMFSSSAGVKWKVEKEEEEGETKREKKENKTKKQEKKRKIMENNVADNTVMTSLYKFSIFFFFI